MGIGKKGRKMNNLFIGDCLIEIEKIDDESIDLIYLDPPFFTQTKHTLKNDKNITFSFEDKWDSITEYKNFIKYRLEKFKTKLKKTGSIFLHCDKSASHHLRVILDDVFGEENFRSEIIWTYKRWSNSKKGLLNAHQNIYFYSKSNDYKFNFLYTDYSPTTNVDQILQKRERDENGKAIYMRDENNEIVFDSPKKGVPLSDVWEIPFLNPKAKERVGYPTQKPIILLEKIIELVTEEGDSVLDPFCGSGTTLVASKLLNRNFYGIDISNDAINLTKERLDTLTKTHSNLMKKGKDSYINKTKEELEILNTINAIPVQRNNGIDGFFKYENLDSLIPVKIQKSNETLEDSIKKLKNAGNKKQSNVMILIKTNNLTSKKLNTFSDVLTNTDEDIIIIESHNLFINKKLDEKFKIGV